MKQIQWKAVTILVVVGLCATAVTADASYSRRGFYVGGGFTYAAHLFEDDLDDLIPELTISLGGSPGLNVQAGYRLLPVLALEGELEWVNSFQGQVEGLPLLDIKAITYTANLRLFIPVYRVQPFVVAGIGGATYSLDDTFGLDLGFKDTATAVRLKAGVDGYITKNLALTVSFGAVLTTHDLRSPTNSESFSGLHYLSGQFGFTYRF